MRFADNCQPPVMRLIRPCVLFRNGLPGPERQFVNGRHYQNVRPVERHDGVRGRRVLRIQIAERLDVFREGVRSREREAVRVALLHAQLQRVVPDLADRNILLAEAGELRERQQQLLAR